MSQVPKEDHHQTLEAVRRRVEQEKLEEQELREAEMASWEEAEVRQTQEIIMAYTQNTYGTNTYRYSFGR